LENSVHRRRDINSTSISLALIGQIKLKNSSQIPHHGLQNISKWVHYIMIVFSGHADKPPVSVKDGIF
jgi:hypothetical protein